MSPMRPEFFLAGIDTPTAIAPGQNSSKVYSDDTESNGESHNSFFSACWRLQQDRARSSCQSDVRYARI